MPPLGSIAWKALILATAPFQQQSAGGLHEPLWTGPEPLGPGGASAQVEDLTGDGVRDFVVEAAQWIQVIDGKSGDTLLERFDQTADFHFDCSDLNGDGVHEILLTDFAFGGGVGKLEVWLGSSRELLWERAGSVSSPFRGFDACMDSDLDGWIDFVVSYDNARESWSGFDGATVWRVAESDQGRVISVSDRNGDGINELFTLLTSGDALVDGASGVELWRSARGIQANPESLQLYNLDVTGDGVDDLYLVEPYAKFKRGWIEARDGLDGSLLWHREGNGDNDQLGMNLKFEDLNGDGELEMISLSQTSVSSRPIALYVLDVRTGGLRWSREWKVQKRTSGTPLRVDLNGDGVRDFVYAELHLSNDSSIHAIDAASGYSLWSQSPLLKDSFVSDLKSVDVDQDGVEDLVVGLQPLRVDGVSRLQAFSGADGMLLWSQEADPGHGFAFSLALFQTSTGRDSVCTVEREPAADGSWLRAFATDTGAELWRSHFESNREEEHSELRVVDLNQDQFPELLSTPRDYWYGSYNGFRLHDLHDQGKLLWLASRTFVENGRAEELVFEADADLDEDGWLDFAYRGEFLGSRSSSDLFVLSGRNGSWKSGVSIDSHAVSAALGGPIRLTVNAGESFGNRTYQFVFSENGLGHSLYAGLEMPFAPSLWLTKTSAQIYPPGLVEEPTGFLPRNGFAEIDLTVPPQSLSPWIGRTLALGVVVIGIRSTPTWSSGAALLEVMP